MISDGRRRRGFGQGIFGRDRRRRRRRAFRAAPSLLGAERDKNLDRASRWAYDLLLSRPACIFIFSLASHRASGSERDRIAHMQRCFFSELGSGLRDRRAPRIRGHCSSAAPVAYIEPEWTLVLDPFLRMMANSGCFAAAGTATAVMALGRTKSGVGGTSKRPRNSDKVNPYEVRVGRRMGRRAGETGH